MNGIERIDTERQRQIREEGWTPEYDDQHGAGELANAAACYAEAARKASLGASWHFLNLIPMSWPWESSWWKPSPDPIRNLEKAGALIAAEIDRLQRKQAKA